MAEGPAGIGAGGRTNGVRFASFDQNDPNDIRSLPTQELLKQLMQHCPNCGGGQQNATQPAGGASPSGGTGAGGYSLEELLAEAARRAQLNQGEMANQLRQVRNTQPGQFNTQGQPTGPGLTNQLLAAAPATFDVGSQGGGLTINSGGIGGGTVA